MSGSRQQSSSRAGTNTLVRLWRGLSVTRRFSIVIALVVAGTAIVQALVLFSVASGGLSKLEEDRLITRTHAVRQALLRQFEHARRDVLSIVETPPVQGLMNVRLGNESDDDSTAEAWRERLETIFAGYLKSNPEIVQARYIGAADGGRELVRVDRRDGEIVVISEDEYQQKLDRDYLYIALSMPEGAVYLSEINLNREFGRIVEPYEPTVRVATPVYSDEGEVFGIIIINIDFGAWTQRMRAEVTQSDRLYVTNENGEYLLHSDPEKSFAFERGAFERLQDDIPELERLFDTGAHETALVNVGDDVIYGYRVSFDPASPSRFLVIVAASPRAILFASTEKMGEWSVMVALAMVALALLIAGWLTRPFLSLMTTARRIVDQEEEGRRAGTDGDAGDVEMLADAFKTMEGAVQERETELRASEATTSAVLESAGNPIITINAAARIEIVNHSARATFGYQEDELIGMHISALMPDAQDWGVGTIPVGSLGGDDHDIGTLGHDGEVIPAQVTVAQVALKDRTIYAISIIDLRGIRKAEKAKNEFVSVVSHELRTPLTSIRGALGLLQGPLKDELTPKAQELAAIAHSNSERLILIINDILDIEKLESGKVKMNLVSLDANAVLREAVENNAPYGDRFDVTFELTENPDEPQVLADAGRLQQILANLLSNAAKFSEGAERVDLGCEVNGAMVRFYVRDHGMGIPDELRPQMFGKFVQGEEALKRKHEGTGLGLAITRTLVEAMKGDITFESSKGEGTTFYFNLPKIAAVPLEITGALEQKGSDVGRVQRVLVCEDDDDTRDILTAWLSRTDGLEVDAVGTLAGARAALRTKDYQVLVLDLILPDGHGISLINQLKFVAVGAVPRVVVVSAKIDEARNDVTGGVFEVARWLPKPVTQEELISAVEETLDSSELSLPRVLHVEDDVDVVRVMAQSLDGMATVMGATTLAAARRILAREQFGLVVLDLELPDGSGGELLDELSAMSDPPVVIILSASEPDSNFQSVAAASFVKSRISEEKLVGFIKGHLKT